MKVGILCFLFITNCLNWKQSLLHRRCSTNIYWINKSYKIMYLYPWRYILVIPDANHYSLFWGSLRHTVKKKTNRLPPTATKNGRKLFEEYKLTARIRAEIKFPLVAWRTTPSITARDLCISSKFQVKYEDVLIIQQVCWREKLFSEILTHPNKQ